MKNFIGPPYWTCPKCGADKFGVMLIDGDSYMRRCRDCWHKADFQLPKLKKKIIYLDQFVVSEIMKLNSPGAKSHAAVAANPFWSQLDELLKELRHFQLICCPASGEHENESLLSPFFANLKKTYENLSGGVSFESENAIKTQQVAALATAWARGTEPEFSLEASRIIHGNPHRWSERYYITTSSYKEQYVDTLREEREKLHNGMTDIFNNTWKVRTFSFAEWYDFEKNSHQKYMLTNVKCRNEKRMRLAVTPWLLSLDDILCSEPENMVRMIADIIRREARSNETIKPGELLESFFTEFRLADAPFNKIGAAMYASIAIKAAGGQKKPPNQGMVTDIEVVSTLLPYCDAMFMDNGCRAILQDIPQSHRPEGVDRVYSMNRKDEFLDYLRSIRASATPEHLELVNQVYGL
jgi:transcription elongation factor Elf1